MRAGGFHRRLVPRGIGASDNAVVGRDLLVLFRPPDQGYVAQLPFPWLERREGEGRIQANVTWKSHQPIDSA